MWDLNTRKLLHQFTHKGGNDRSLTIQNDYKFCLSGGDNLKYYIKIWNLEKKKRSRTLHLHNNIIHSI